MRFGISATSWIFPKNLRTRLRPVNVCAISSLALSNCRARDDSPEGRHPSRPSGQPSKPSIVCDSADCRSAMPLPERGRDHASAGARQRYGRFRGSRTPESLALPSHLLEFHLGSGLFQLSLDFVGLVFADAFLDRLGRTLDQVFCLLEPQTRERAHFLYHLDLLLADGGKDDGELGLLLGRSGGSATAWSCGDGHGGRGGNAPLLLEHFRKICGLRHPALR